MAALHGPCSAGHDEPFESLLCSCSIKGTLDSTPMIANIASQPLHPPVALDGLEALRCLNLPVNDEALHAAALSADLRLGLQIGFGGGALFTCHTCGVHAMYLIEAWGSKG